jgi:formylglycine-generating enzyme required for sulfatase activity
MPDQHNTLEFDQFMNGLLARLGWKRVDLADALFVHPSTVTNQLKGKVEDWRAQLSFVEGVQKNLALQLIPEERTWLSDYHAWLGDRADNSSRDTWLEWCERALPGLGTAQRNNYLNLVKKAYGQPQGGRVRRDHAEIRDEPPPEPIGRFQQRDTKVTREFVEAYMQMDEIKQRPLPPDLTLLEWLQRPENQRIALLAVAGCGKTTALYEMAYEAADTELPKDVVERLPVFVSLGDYSEEDGPLEKWWPRGARKALSMHLPEGLEAAIDDFGPVEEQLERLRRAGRLLLLIDGLNELPGGANGALRPKVNEFIRTSTRNQIVVACRVADYRNTIAELLKRVELLRLDEERVYEAVRGHLTQLGDEAEADRVIEELSLDKNKELRIMLQIPLYVWAFSRGLSKCPDTGLWRLPANRGQLLDQCVQRLLAEEFNKAGGARLPVVGARDLHEGLARIAYHLRKDEKSRGSTKPLSVFMRHMPADIIGLFARPIDALAQADGAGLLDVDRKSGKISFWKEPIEEVLAGRHILSLLARRKVVDCQDLWKAAQMRGEVPPVRPSTGNSPQHPSAEGPWVDVTILAVGLTSDPDSLVAPDDFVSAVLAVNPWLAGRCIHEGGAQVSDAVRTKVQRALLDLMQDPAYSVRARVPCGVLLGELGDHRFHGKELFCLPRKDLLGFIKVPAGPFIMGSDRKTVEDWNREAETAGGGSGHYDDELWDQEQDLPHDYLIARYPVTNAQFRCFLEDEDGGYPKWEMDDGARDWTADGLKWVLGDRWSEALEASWRRAYQGGRYKGWKNEDDFIENGVKPHLRRLRKDGPAAEYWTNPDYSPPNQPVVGLTWYEAAAYASWLHRKLLTAQQCPPELRRLLENGLRVRLPSEPEWEKAARGGLQIPGADGRLVDNARPRRQWPWEGAWDADRCSTAEGDDPVRWLSPAGMYPDGRSPYGCLDMVGNVWEWTRSRYASYPYPADEASRRDREDPENIGSPVLRGGSWDLIQWDARCAVRHWVDPDYLDGDVGLRLVVSLSDSGS